MRLSNGQLLLFDEAGGKTDYTPALALVERKELCTAQEEQPKAIEHGRSSFRITIRKHRFHSFLTQPF